MNRCNVPGKAWFLCLEWTGDVMNPTAEESLGWRPPLEVLTGQTIDISIILCFMFWDVIYVPKYKTKEVGDKDSEICGHFVGFAWNVGHTMTFKILTDETQESIAHSRVRLTLVGENNLRQDIRTGAVPERVYIRSPNLKKVDDPDF